MTHHRWTYTEELADAVCMDIASGRTLTAICQDSDMPSIDTVLRWLQKNPDFKDRYRVAQELRAETMMDELCKIADDGINDSYIDEFGKKKVDVDNIARSRLRVDTRKWMVTKLFPKKYGDRVEANITGSMEVTGITRKIIDITPKRIEDDDQNLLEE